MGGEEIIKALIGAVIAYSVPKAFDSMIARLETTTVLPWLKWCVAGFMGGALGGFVSALLGVTGLSAAGLGNWSAFGACLGIFQWFALRGYRDVGSWFVLASAIGWMLFMVGGTFGWVVAGLAVGLMQYLSLTKWKNAHWWIIGNLLAWPIAGWVGVMVGTPLLAVNPALAWVTGWGVVGLVGAIILLVPLTQLGRESAQLHPVQ